ncbi:Mis12 protein-domain-containing protein [Endogone sp. FLAS-F59071]|nr:Mis12 protein-domain-containing protein [Endogone sp. FLAS-F59071]|eukprot:RUS20535.1 Mis12 protein-domain-containing protein [Endogone sp. FLAS-F59071]
MATSSPFDKNAELVVEHLGFFPLSFVDDVFNATNDLIYQATAELERFIEAEQGAGEETEQGIHQVETLLESAIDKNFDLFELYVLQNTFAVRDDVNIVLEHHEGLDFSASQEDEAQLDEELNEIRRKAKAMNHKLKNEITSTDRRVERLEKCKQQIEFLTSMSKGQEVSPIDDTLSFVTDQISALQSLLASVRGEVDARDLFNRLQNEGDARSAYISNMVMRQVEAKRRRREGAREQGSGTGDKVMAGVEEELKGVVEQVGTLQEWQEMDTIMSNT